MPVPGDQLPRKSVARSFSPALPMHFQPVHGRRHRDSGHPVIHQGGSVALSMAQMQASRLTPFFSCTYFTALARGNPPADGIPYFRPLRFPSRFRSRTSVRGLYFPAFHKSDCRRFAVYSAVPQSIPWSEPDCRNHAMSRANDHCVSGQA